MSESVQAVVWDLDGTLVDSVVDLAASVNVVLTEQHAAALAEDQIRAMIGNGVGKLLDRAAAAAGLTGEAANPDALYRRFTEHYADNCCNATRVYDGVIETLSTLRARGFKQGVCTNKPESMARTVIATLQIGEYFSAIVGGDSTAFRKPHKAPMLMCLEQMGCAAERSLMVGDSAADVELARNCNMPVYVLPYGYTVTPAAQLGADRVISRATDLLALLPDSAVR